MSAARSIPVLGRFLCGLLGLLALVFEANAQGQLPEAQLKAAFVLNFVRYVEWPENAFPGKEAPIVLCVVGRDDGAVAFAAIDGRKVQERTIKLRLDVGVDSLRSCQVVFIGEAGKRRVSGALRSLQGLPVLTISDVDGFIDNGGAIGIVRGEQRLQFEINRTALDEAGLKASSQLLKLARAVLTPGG